MSPARIIAIVTTGLIGLSGLGVGISLMTILTIPGDDRVYIGFLIGAGIAAYGLIAALGAYGIWRGNVLAWWVAVIAIAGGLIALIRLATLGAALDEVFVVGAVLWAADLAALLLPGTRRSLRTGGPTPGG